MRSWTRRSPGLPRSWSSRYVALQTANIAAAGSAVSRSPAVGIETGSATSWTSPRRLPAPACLQGQPAQAGETLYAGNKSYEAELEALIASRNATRPELTDAPSVVSSPPNFEEPATVWRYELFWDRLPGLCQTASGVGANALAKCAVWPSKAKIHMGGWCRRSQRSSGSRRRRRRPRARPSTSCRTCRSSCRMCRRRCWRRPAWCRRQTVRTSLCACNGLAGHPTSVAPVLTYLLLRWNARHTSCWIAAASQSCVTDLLATYEKTRTPDSRLPSMHSCAGGAV